MSYSGMGRFAELLFDVGALLAVAAMAAICAIRMLARFLGGKRRLVKW
jgi:hypothetical protein